MVDGLQPSERDSMPIYVPDDMSFQLGPQGIQRKRSLISKRSTKKSDKLQGISINSSNYDDNHSRQSSKRKQHKKKLPKINLEIDYEDEEQVIQSGRLNLIKEAPISTVQENINAIDQFIDPLHSKRKQNDSDF